ncbi:MAG: hydantoinase/oxoprolinase family protein, partial [Acetobacterales bacterium]
MHYRLGADIGGTFTDIVLLDPTGAVHSKKILSTPDDYARAIQEGTRDLLAEIGVDAKDVKEFSHGTTVATNAIIERKGVKVGLITTDGFRDVLEIGRFRLPKLYDMSFVKPTPLVERRLRKGVTERIGADGSVVEPLDEAAVTKAVEELIADGVDAIAICFLNSYVNPEHEKKAAAAARKAAKGVAVTASCEIVPQIQEYERTSTTVVNAYIRPVVERYVQSLKGRMQDLGVNVPVMIMQSSGGVLSADKASESPVFIIESGPAAGVVGAQRLGARIGVNDLMVLDMGGTTAKASLIEDGDYDLTPEIEVGGMQAGQRMVQGAGYIVQFPTIDIAEVGAGGGSVAWQDPGGGMKVGPHSAGAVPGPVCYDNGGTEPTVTDANLFLGYINPGSLVGGDLKVNAGKAKAAIEALGEKLGLDATACAWGIHRIANANMMRALRGVSTERGRDPRNFALFA